MGHYPGAGRGPQWLGRHAGFVRAPGAGGGAIYRRRLRPQDHDVLSRGGAAALAGNTTGAAGQMDRGPRRAFPATTQERSQVHDVEIALSADGRILGIRDEFLHDSGAYDPYGLTVPLNSQCTLLGPYVVPAYDSRFTAVFTTLPIVSPYRGAGRQHGMFVIERLLDIAARKLGLDRAEIRRRNFIAPDAFPYDNHIIYQDFAPLHYDSGDYGQVLDKALEV